MHPFCHAPTPPRRGDDGALISGDTFGRECWRSGAQAAGLEVWLRAAPEGSGEGVRLRMLRRCWPWRSP